MCVERIAAAIVCFETPGLGVNRLRGRLEQAGDPLALLRRAPATDAARRRWERATIRAEARRRARRLVRAGGRLLAYGDADFPPGLKRPDWAPGCIYVRGAASWPEQIATVVGTRRALPSALCFARQIAEETAARGIAIASGLALGIDAAAHRGALAAGGPTLAVLGTGLDRCYPRAHARLQAEVAERGLLVSELPPGTETRAYQFPARNRILATLADAVAVVQAPAASGALNTAGHALDAGVELLAAPGDPLLWENAGSNGLLVDGARPLLEAADLVAAVRGREEAATGTSGVPPPLPPELVVLDRRLLAALDLAPRQLDELAAAARLEVPVALGRVARLELDGWVETLPGGRVRLTPYAARFDRGRSGRARTAGRGSSPAVTV